MHTSTMSLHNTTLGWNPITIHSLDQSQKYWPSLLPKTNDAPSEPSNIQRCLTTSHPFPVPVQRPSQWTVISSQIPDLGIPIGDPNFLTVPSPHFTHPIAERILPKPHTYLARFQSPLLQIPAEKPVSQRSSDAYLLICSLMRWQVHIRCTISKSLARPQSQVAHFQLCNAQFSRMQDWSCSFQPKETVLQSEKPLPFVDECMLRSRYAGKLLCTLFSLMTSPSDQLTLMTKTTE